MADLVPSMTLPCSHVLRKHVLVACAHQWHVVKGGGGHTSAGETEEPSLV